MANATVSKVTKVEKLSAIIDILKENEIDVISIKGEDVSAIDTLQHEINLNKSKAEKSKSKKAVDNSDWETKIVEALEGGKVELVLSMIHQALDVCPVPPDDRGADADGDDPQRRLLETRDDDQTRQRDRGGNRAERGREENCDNAYGKH